MKDVFAALAALGTGVIGGVFFAFLVTFLGTVPLLAAATWTAWSAGDAPAATWLGTAWVLYTAGTVGVTIACNVPRNDRLARLAPESREALEYWPVYVRDWLMWNHVRCAAAVAALAAVVVAVTR